MTSDDFDGSAGSDHNYWARIQQYDKKRIEKAELPTVQSHFGWRNKTKVLSKQLFCPKLLENSLWVQTCEMRLDFLSPLW